MDKKRELLEKIEKRLGERQEEMIAIRRHLHAHPELSFEEKETSAYIAAFYEGKPCTVKTGFGGGYGIVVDISAGEKAQGRVALRADFDALPIQEETGLSFASRNPGVMHACGHDAHTAYMLILADVLMEYKEELPMHVRILHQPAEEKAPGGAISMVKAGCLKEVERVFGIHLFTTLPLGEISVHPGAAHSGRSPFRVEIIGKGGHGSAPHEAKDAIVAGAQFVSALQSLISRRLDPYHMGVATVGSFDGRGSSNIICDHVVLEGDTRVMNEGDREILETEFRRILSGICEAYGCTYTLDYKSDYPVLVNDEAISKALLETLQVHRPEGVKKVYDGGPLPPSEDFAYFLQEVPGCFFWVGCRPEQEGKAYPHHHPRFELEEESMLIAARAMATAFLYA